MFPGHAHYLLPDRGVLVTEGHVRASVCWGEGPQGDLLAPPTHKTGITPTSDIHRIKEWIGTVHVCLVHVVVMSCLSLQRSHVWILMTLATLNCWT